LPLALAARFKIAIAIAVAIPVALAVASEHAAKARWNNQVPSTVPSQLRKLRNLPHIEILMKTYQLR
jgi:hypothetical protein